MNINNLTGFNPRYVDLLLNQNWRGLDSSDFEKICEQVGEVTLIKGESSTDLLVRSNLANNKSEAQSILDAGLFSVSGQEVDTDFFMLPMYLYLNTFVVLRKGPFDFVMGRYDWKAFLEEKE